MIEHKVNETKRKDVQELKCFVCGNKMGVKRVFFSVVDRRDAVIYECNHCKNLEKRMLPNE